ncbi:MAG TPA: helix-turn-helix domain-containing protein [Anaeromyxobacter sp.]
MTPADALGAALGPLVDVPGRIAALDARLARIEEALATLRRSTPSALVPIDEAARILGVSVSTVRRQVRSGAIPSRRIGRSVRVDLAALRPLEAEEVERLAREARSPTGTR